MSDHTDLSAILGGSPAMPTPEPEPTATETVAEAPEPEAPAEAPAEAPKAAPAPAPKAEPQMVPLAALQEARERARELERRLSAATKPPAPAPAPPPDIFAEPEKLIPHVQGMMQQEVMNARLDISEEMARTQFGDETVDAAFQEYQARAASDPSIAAKVMGSRSPWTALVKWHQTEQARAEFGDDPVAYRAKVEADIRAKIAAEQATRKPATPAAPSLATQPNLGSRAAPQWAGPTPLDRILGR